MTYDLTSPCGDCPFLAEFAHAFTLERLAEHASGHFHCHKTGAIGDDGKFIATPTSKHCAGALIFLERRGLPNQMMRIVERLGLYDSTKLNMQADVR